MAERKALRGVVVGAGYFSQFHHEAWQRLPEVAITAVCDLEVAKARATAQQYGIAQVYGDYREMIARERPDFIDIITPPPTHRAISTHAAQQGVHVICQKPLAPSYAESLQIVETMEASGVRFMVHENWRWQPWYREIKTLIRQEVLGELFSLHFFMRMGDGWGEDAYLGRQPFFRAYPRLLVYETGVHFLDTFRFLLGEVETVYARLRRLNPVIKGEDSGQIVLGFANGATAVWDSNRYNESEAADPRYTFGEMRLDGRHGHLRLDLDGEITLKRLGQTAQPHDYPRSRHSFAGDCVYALQRHFVENLYSGEPFESHGRDYLRTIQLVEAVYQSAALDQVVTVTKHDQT